MIIGKSGCGKTTLLINLSLCSCWLDYNNTNIFGKSLFQPEYHILKKAFEEKLPKDVIIRLFENENEITDLGISPISVVEEMAKEVRYKSDVECNFYQSPEDVPDPRDLSPEKKNIIVFDDLLLEKQNTCESYYVRRRQSSVDCFYLAQNYFKLPCQTIRENTNFMSVSPRPEEPKPHFRGSGSDMTREEFRQLCKVAWEKQHGFVIIDLSSKKHNGKYRSGLEEFYIPNETLKKKLILFSYYKKN